MSRRLSSVVQAFAEEDVSDVLALMRGLAEFEGYLEDFAVTESDLIRHGLGARPRFQVFVARSSPADPVRGIAVVYVIPWTYDLKPTLVLKELFVHPQARGSGLGTLLMRRVSRHAVEIGAPRLIWSVLKSNTRGAAFYAALSATQDTVWDAWSLDASAIRELGKPELGKLELGK